MPVVIIVMSHKKSSVKIMLAGIFAKPIINNFFHFWNGTNQF